MDLYKFDDAHYLPSEQYPLHKQDTWELTYIVKGKGKRTIGDSVMEFGDGDLVFIPPHIPHFWDFDKDYTDDKGMVNHIALSFRTELLDRWSSAFPEFTERIEHLKTVSSGTSFDPATDAVIADCILKMREEKPSEYLPFVMRLILKIEENIDSTFVVGRASETDRASERLNKVRLFTTNNYARTITIDMVADHVGMNRSSFCTFFKKTTGQTYITYLNKLRVARRMQPPAPKQLQRDRGVLHGGIQRCALLQPLLQEQPRHVAQGVCRRRDDQASDTEDKTHRQRQTQQIAFAHFQNKAMCKDGS